MGETTLEDFKEAGGVDVKMDLFDTNDTLFAKFRAGNPGYDLIVPSNDFVERMAKADMLEKIDKAQLQFQEYQRPNLSMSIMTRVANIRCPILARLGHRLSQVEGAGRA